MRRKDSFLSGWREEYSAVGIKKTKNLATQGRNRHAMPWTVSAEEANTQAILSHCDEIKDVGREHMPVQPAKDMLRLFSSCRFAVLLRLIVSPSSQLQSFPFGTLCGPRRPHHW